MTGDEQIRVCAQCNLKVHNISAMSEVDAAIVLKRRQTERACIYYRRKLDGKIVVDNCPVSLRTARNRLLKLAAFALLSLAYGMCLSAQADGGLIGTCIDPAFGQSNELGMLADYGYDTARDISRFLTLSTFIVTFFFPIDKSKKISLRRDFLELLALTAAPILVHLVGTYIINNFGGLGGGI